jgi:hypothetical protein
MNLSELEDYGIVHWCEAYPEMLPGGLESFCYVFSYLFYCVATIATVNSLVSACVYFAPGAIQDAFVCYLCLSELPILGLQSSVRSFRSKTFIQSEYVFRKRTGRVAWSKSHLFQCVWKGPKSLTLLVIGSQLADQ